MFFALLACFSSDEITTIEPSQIQSYQTEVSPSLWPMDFPAAQDLALVFEGETAIVYENSILILNLFDDTFL